MTLLCNFETRYSLICPSFKPIIEDSSPRLVSEQNRYEWVRVLPGEQAPRQAAKAPHLVLVLISSRFLKEALRSLHPPLLVRPPLVDRGLPKLSTHEPPRVEQFYRRTHCGRCDMRIPHCHDDCRVPEERLHYIERNALHREMRSERVTESVPRNSPQTNPRTQAIEMTAKPVMVQRLSVRIREHIAGRFSPSIQILI